MKRTGKRLPPRLVAAAVGGMVALAAGAPSALGADFTLELSGPPAGQAGEPTIVEATGTAPPPADYWFPIWLDLVVVPAGLVPTCPANYLDGDQVAVHTFKAGGEVLTPYALRVRPDAAGGFAHAVGYTPRVAGTMRLCGYIEDGLTYTHVSTSMTLDVRPADVQPPPAGQPPAAQPPRAVRRPRVTRAGKRLACAPGRWSGDPGGYAYSWVVGGRRKDGATRPVLRVTRRLRGRKVRCAVTATNAAGATTARSPALRVR